MSLMSRARNLPTVFSSFEDLPSDSGFPSHAGRRDGVEERRNEMLRRTLASLVLLALTTAYLSPLAASAAPSPKKNTPKRNAKLAPEFDNASATPNDFVRVVIQTKGRPTSAQESAINSKGGAKARTFDALDAFTAVVPKGSLAELAARDDVSYISPDRAVKSQLAVTRETTGAALAQAGLQGAPGVNGKGVGIGRKSVGAGKARE